MILRSLLCIGFVGLPVIPGRVFAADPSRNPVEQAILAMEWKGLSAVRCRVFADWSAIDSATRILKLGADPQVTAELEKTQADLMEAKARLAAKTSQMEAKLGAEELKQFKKEQTQEAALVKALQALEVMGKERRSAEKEAAALRAEALALGASLKPLRAQISSGLSGVPIPREIQSEPPGHP